MTLRHQSERDQVRRKTNQKLRDTIRQMRSDIATLATLKIRPSDNSPELIRRVRNILSRHRK